MNHQHQFFFLKTASAILLACCFSMNISCGRKAPPLPPKAVELPVVDKIDVNRQGDSLKLSWPVPKAQGQPAEDLAGFYVYRSKEKMGETGCSECPARFDKVADIPYDKMSAMIETQAVYSEKLEKGYRYQYRVTCYDQYGNEGTASKTIRIDY